MAISEYKDELDRKNMEEAQKIISYLPDYVTDYFISRKSNTTAKTRLSYAFDLRLFFIYYIRNIKPELFDEESHEENLKDPEKMKFPFNYNAGLKRVTTSHLSELKARDIEFFMEYLQIDKERANHKSGVARKYAALSSFFDYLYRNDKIPENPCAKVLPVRPTKDNRIIRLSPDEVSRFLNAIESVGEDLTEVRSEYRDLFTEHQRTYLQKTVDRDLAIATVFLGTGIRLSELVGLNIADVNLEKCQMSVLGKGDKYRMVALGDETIDTLKKYLDVRLQMTGVSSDYENALFLSAQKRRMTPQAVENLIVKYAKAIGLQDRITPHKLRKTFGTSLYQETGDIYLVANSLGHNNVNTTKNHYVAQSEQNLLDARNKVKLRD